MKCNIVVIIIHFSIKLEWVSIHEWLVCEGWFDDIWVHVVNSPWIDNHIYDIVLNCTYYHIEFIKKYNLSIC